MSLIIKLIYFRQSGKYYTEGQYTSYVENAYQVFEEIKAMQRESRLPGIGGGPQWHIVFIGDESPQQIAVHIHPALFPALEREV